MNGSHLSFKQEPNTKPRDEWVTFDISGTRLSNGETWSEDFTCLPEVPGGALDDLTASVGVDAQGRMTFNKVSVLRFMRSVIVEEDEQKFDAMVHDKDKLVQLETLGDMMMRVAEAIVGRPIGPRSTSQVGSRSNGDTSGPASFS